MSETFEPNHHHHHLSAEFARVVAPLEQASRRRLGNPQRHCCLEAFEKFPDGVGEVARTSLADATSSPLGLFWRRIQHGWHELEPLPEEKDSVPAEPSGCSTIARPDSGPYRAEVWLEQYGYHYADTGPFADELAKVVPGLPPERVDELRRRGLELLREREQNGSAAEDGVA